MLDINIQEDTHTSENDLTQTIETHHNDNTQTPLTPLAQQEPASSSTQWEPTDDEDDEPPECVALYGSDSEEDEEPFRPERHNFPSNIHPPVLDRHDQYLSPAVQDQAATEDASTRTHRQHILRTSSLVPSQVLQRNTDMQEFAAPQLSAAHQEENEYANYYIGDTLALPKPPNTTRLYFQNVNDISLAAPGTWETTCMDLRDMQVDMGLLVEHKLDTTQPRVMKRLHDDIKPVLNPGTFSINATSSQVQAQSMFKPGGVLSLTNGGLKGRILESGKDIHGRWVYSKFRRNTGPPVTVIATYQVVDKSPQTSGPTTYATQLYAAYIAEGRTDPARLRHHHANDLVEFIKKCQARGEWMVVAGDFNEVLGETT